MPVVSPRPMHVPAGLPIDESIRPEILEVGQANLSNINVRQPQRGSLEKRLGFGPLSAARLDGTSRIAGSRLFSRGDQMCTIDGTYLDVYSEAAACSVVRDLVPEASVSLRGVPTMGRGLFASCEDQALANGYVVLSYAIDAGSVITINGRHGVVVLDALTGTTVRGPEIIDSSSDMADVRLASYGNYVIAFTCDKATSQIRTKYLDTTSPSTISAGWQTLATFSDFLDGFDVGNCATDDRVSMAYVSSVVGPVGTISVRTLTIAGSIDSVDIVATAAVHGLFTLSLSEDGDTLWLAYLDDDVNVIGLDPSNLGATPLAAHYIVTTMGAGQSALSVHVCARAGAKAAVYIQVRSDTSLQLAFYTQFRGIKTTAGAAGSDGFLTTIGGSLIQSRPFLRGGRVYAHFDSYGNFNPQGGGQEGVLCDCTPPAAAGVPYLRPVAVALQRGLSRGSVRGRRRTVELDANRSMMPVIVAEGGGTSATLLAIYDFGDPGRWQSARVNGATYLGGGVTSLFDGSKVFESGFLVIPPPPQTDNTTGTGVTFTNGRKYVATYEHVDAEGNWHVSGVSLPSAISGAQTDKELIVRIAPCSITSRGTRATADFQGQSLHIVIYATLDRNIGTEPFYRVGTAINDPDLPLINFSDQISDDNLAGQALLYGTGNLPGTGAGQDHRAPPGLTHIVSYNGMLVGSLGKVIYWTSQPIDGEGQWWSPLFSLVIDDDVTGLSVQDGSVYAFTATGLFTVSGEPPSDNGFQGGLGSPRRLSCDVGSVDGITVVTSFGIFFRSHRGIELLNRGGSIQWIGEKVRRTFAAFPVLSSAALDDVNDIVRFSLAATRGADGRVSGAGRDLIFDLTLGAWVSVDDKRGSIASEPSQDACMVTVGDARRYAWLGTDGVIHVEKLLTDGTAWLDGSNFITSQYEVPPWKLGLQQEQRVFEAELIVEQYSKSGLTIEVANDLGAYGAVTPDKVWTEAETNGQRRFPFRPKSRGSSVGFRVRDTAPSPLGSGRGFTFIGLSIDVAPIQGATRATPRLASELRR